MLKCNLKTIQSLQSQFQSNANALPRNLFCAILRGPACYVERTRQNKFHVNISWNQYKETSFPVAFKIFVRLKVSKHITQLESRFKLMVEVEHTRQKVFKIKIIGEKKQAKKRTS